jgi:hypothetical protein
MIHTALSALRWSSVLGSLGRTLSALGSPSSSELESRSPARNCGDSLTHGCTACTYTAGQTGRKTAGSMVHAANRLHRVCQMLVGVLRFTHCMLHGTCMLHVGCCAPPVAWCQLSLRVACCVFDSCTPTGAQSPQTTGSTAQWPDDYTFERVNPLARCTLRVACHMLCNICATCSAS